MPSSGAVAGPPPGISRRSRRWVPWQYGAVTSQTGSGIRSICELARSPGLMLAQNAIGATNGHTIP